MLAASLLAGLSQFGSLNKLLIDVSTDKRLIIGGQSDYFKILKQIKTNGKLPGSNYGVGHIFISF